MRQFLQTAATTAIGWINAIINAVNQGLRRLGLPTIPNVGGVNLGAAPVLSGGPGTQQPPAPGRAAGMEAMQITIPVHIGERKIDTIVVDVMNRTLRARQPGLGIT
jgi:hypothetical protein